MILRKLKRVLCVTWPTVLLSSFYHNFFYIVLQYQGMKYENSINIPNIKKDKYNFFMKEGRSLLIHCNADKRASSFLRFIHGILKTSLAIFEVVL